MLANIRLVHVKKGVKLYNLRGTFNVVISGRINCMATHQRYKRFDVLSDLPIQVNQLDYSQPLSVLTEQQQIDTLSALEVRGIQTQNVLSLQAADT